MTGVEIALAGLLAYGQVIPVAQKEIVKHAGLQAIHADGALTLRLVETGRTEAEGDDGSKTVTINLRDEHYPFFVTRHVKTWKDCGAVETWYEIRHDEPSSVKLIRADSFASRVEIKAKEVSVLTLTGEWAIESNLTEGKVANGQIAQYLSLSGTRDAWESNAAMMVSFGETDEENGKVLGVALEWTGPSEKRVRRSWNGEETDVFAGVAFPTGPYTLDPGKTFATPKAILVWSENGRGEVSRQYHRWARNHLLPHGTELHPVLLNSWEGSYFSFTEKTLHDMMDGVKEMGGEMFVVDDGWFGLGKHARDEKNRATVGLGDWVVNPKKLPHGMDGLAQEAAKRGLKFGLWVEPEMASYEASGLAVANPDWLLREKNRSVLTGRGGSQVVLDYTNPAVTDNIFKQLDALYSSVPSLAYVKWDCNQNIVNPGSTHLPADRQGNLWYDYTVSLYGLWARLQAKYPQIMMQACASGGGHMDFGSLRYADEFWTSDRTDPYNRVFMQWGAGQFYPAIAMACHVTQSGRKTPLKYRFDVAMTGRMGFELHPENLKPEEIEFGKKAVADYKRIRPVVQRGDLYRLVSPYGGEMAALAYLSETGDRAVVFALGLEKEGKIEKTMRLPFVDPSAGWSVKEINVADRTHGGTLEGGALSLALEGKYDSAVFEIVKK